MNINFLVSVHHLLPETRMKILPLLSDNYEERRQRLAINRNHDDYHLSCVAGSILSFLAKSAFEEGDYALAENASLRYNDFFWAARAAKIQGNVEEARKYFSRYIEQVANHNGEHPSPYMFGESKEYFSGDELKQLFMPLTEKFGGNIPLLIKTFLAKETIDTDFVKKAYRNSKRKLARFHKREIPDYEDEEASFDHYSIEMELESDHSELCEIIGRFDEAIEFILKDGLNGCLLLHEPFSDHVERRDDRDEIYKKILRDMHLVSPPDSFSMAVIAEKLGEQKRAREYYGYALDQNEKYFNWVLTSKAAKKLGLEERAQAYSDVAAYLYEHRHI